jgi:hypothetical protein
MLLTSFSNIQLRAVVGLVEVWRPVLWFLVPPLRSMDLQPVGDGCARHCPAGSIEEGLEPRQVWMTATRSPRAIQCCFTCIGSLT